MFVLETQNNLFALGLVLKKILVIAMIANCGCLANGRDKGHL